MFGGHLYKRSLDHSRWCLSLSKFTVNKNEYINELLVVSSTWQRSVNPLVCMLWLLQLYGASRSHSTSQPFVEHYHQTDLTVLALWVFIVGVHCGCSRWSYEASFLHCRQSDLYTLALRVVIAGVTVIMNGSFHYHH